MKKILVLEDDQEFLDLMLMILEDNQVRSATSVEHLGKFADFNPAIIFTDLSLSPGDNVAKLVELLRSLFGSAEVVLVSGNHEVVQISRKLGLRFLKKPFEVEELLAFV